MKNRIAPVDIAGRDGLQAVTSRHLTTALLTVTVVLCGSPADAQIRASERATVSQTVDGAVIEVDYARPRLRGRIAFGGVVHWGEMWTPGANWATTLRVSRDVFLAGRTLPAGAYSMWVVPTRDTFTLHLHWEPRLYHLQRPDRAEMFLSLPLTPRVGPPTDLLTFDFPETSRDGATLRLAWGSTQLRIPIHVPPSQAGRATLTAQGAAPYLGRYVAWLFGENRDSTRLEARLDLRGGRIVGTLGGGVRTFELVPVGEHRFLFELHDEEGPFDVELDSPVVFTVDREGRATGFWMRGIEQPLWMRGARVLEPPS